MSRTPILLNQPALGKNTLRITQSHIIDDRLEIEILEPNTDVWARVTLTPEYFSKQLNLIPGFTVKYTKPIEIPKYLGAVVERRGSIGRPPGAVFERYVRWARHDQTSLPWVDCATGKHVAEDDIAAVLANGGYEREPEFPVRTP